MRTLEESGDVGTKQNENIVVALDIAISTINTTQHNLKGDKVHPEVCRPCVWFMR